jgi:hypothetical protein
MWVQNKISFISCWTEQTCVNITCFFEPIIDVYSWPWMVCKAQDGISNITVVIMAGIAQFVQCLTTCQTVLCLNPGIGKRFSLFHSHPGCPEPVQHPVHWVLRCCLGGKWAGVWHLSPTCVPLCELRESSSSWNPRGLSRPAMGLLCLWLCLCLCLCLYLTLTVLIVIDYTECFCKILKIVNTWVSL